MVLFFLVSCKPAVPDEVWPLTFHRGHPVARIEVLTDHGTEGRHCLVDTGSTFSLSRLRGDRVAIAGSSYLLEHEPETLAALGVAGFDPPLDCVVGQDLLSRRPIARLDSRRRELRLTDRRTDLPRTEPLLSHEPVVEVSVAGIPRCLLLDTGATTTALSPTVFDAAGLAAANPVEVATQVGRGAVLEAPIALQWAGATSHRAVRHDVVSLRRFASREVVVVGLLGADLLSQFEVLELRWVAREVGLDGPNPESRGYGRQ